MSELNDPRVFFAAERTLLAWNRTSLALMAFGFMIERFALVMQLMTGQAAVPEYGTSFWVGLGFVLLGALASAWSAQQYRSVVRSLRPVEIPPGYSVNTGPLLNLAIAGLGLLLMGYLALG